MELFVKIVDGFKMFDSILGSPAALYFVRKSMMFDIPRL